MKKEKSYWELSSLGAKEVLKREETFEALLGERSWALSFLGGGGVPQHFFIFLPEPQGQGSFLPALSTVFLQKEKESILGEHFSPQWERMGLGLHVPMASPPWTGVGKRLESLCRKALYEFELLTGVDHVAVALSGGKDSLTLLYLLHALSGRGFSPFKITAIHVSGAFSCGASVSELFVRGICEKLGVEYVVCEAEQREEELECYSCSRTRRSLLFAAAKERGIGTIAFGHHRDDSVQTLLMNLLHKAEFASLLPKVPMHDYGVTIIRPLIYAEEREIVEFAKLYGFSRITCQCPVGAKSLRQKTKKLLTELEAIYPNARENLSHASFLYGSKKALDK